MATVLVQEGTLRVGDVIVCGDGFGRVRAIFNDKGRLDRRGRPVDARSRSPGLDVVPTAGENFAVVDDISRAREVAEARRIRARDARPRRSPGRHAREPLQQDGRAEAQEPQPDPQGRRPGLDRGPHQGAREARERRGPDPHPARRAVGGITESDIVLADASQAIVIGFRVAPEDRAVTLAEEKKIEIRRYDIIYQVTDDIKKAVEGMLVPEIKEVHLGRAVVRQVFKISKVGAVAGCFVTQGTIERSAKVRLDPRGPRDLQGLDRGPQAVQGRRQGSPAELRVRHQDRQLRRRQGRRRHRGLPDRHHPPDALSAGGATVSQ